MNSFYYILYNEAENIVRSLESIKQYVDEIIICIDNKTTDNTEKVITEWFKNDLKDPKGKTYSIKIFRFDWTGFADARNFAVSKCTGDYIITIDGHEVLEHFTEPNGDYMICTVANEVKGHTSYFPSIRCFKNGLAKYEGTIQAIPDLSLKDKTAGTGLIQIRHYGYDLTKEQLIEKTQKNLKEHLKQLVEDPENVTVEYYLSQCYRFLGEFNLAINYGLLSLHKPINTITRALVYINLYLSYKAIGEDYFATRYLMESIKQVPIQILSRLYLLQEISGKDLKEEHIQIIEKININKNSNLPNDVYLSQESLNQLRSN